VAYTTYLAHRSGGLDGIGFVLTPTDPYVAVDIDSCIKGAEIESRAAQIVEELRSYTEVSPSGRGIRILLASPDFQTNARTAETEVYSHSRYVTVTGHHVVGTPADISTASADAIATRVPTPPKHVNTSLAPVSRIEPYPVGDMELWERIFAHDKYGREHLQRFQGDTSLDHSDHSFTVIRLLNCLARWTECDPAKMRSMMLMSPLANEKWFERRGQSDWLNYQIANAIDYVRK
jgi:putative DNA primase/helicase